MEFYIKKCKIKIEFSFILVLSFATLLDVDSLVKLLFFSGVHELAHLLTLILFGGSADSLTFSFYGLALKYSSPLSRIKEFFVILSGPAVNLILYLILKDDINLILFCLNVLPVYPLDGGRILNLYSYRISNAVSKVFLILIIILSFYMIIAYKSFSMLLIAVYLTAYSIMY